jgi:hypothetical protein
MIQISKIFVLQKWISQCNILSKEKTEMLIALKSSFQVMDYRIVMATSVNNNIMLLLIDQSSRWVPVLQHKTSKTLFGPVIFSLFYFELNKNKFKNLIRTSKFFSFYFELYQNKFKNLIQTSKFKFSFWGLLIIVHFEENISTIVCLLRICQGKFTNHW